ncbi:MAG: PKD domain-containing protein [Colwellia sp.]
MNMLSNKKTLKKSLRCGILAMVCAGLSGHAFAAKQMEYIDRSVIAVKANNGVYLGWRMFGDDDATVGFNVYKDGKKLNSEVLTSSTNYFDSTGTEYSIYSIKPVVNEVEQVEMFAKNVWDNQYKTISLSRPDGGTLPGMPAPHDENGEDVTYTYSPNDVSVGDLNGDGQYEYIVKWDPSNSHDNAHEGYTGNVYIDAYKLDGTQLWRIDLGQNIRAGAHYTQFMVYDLDGDGKAEIAMKTADGTIDGAGTVLGDADADYRGADGRVLAGPEFLTVFNGETGAEMASTAYIPERGDIRLWRADGTGYGNRVDRFLAGIAYLDGDKPSLVFSRGYYDRSVIAAWDWRDNKLTSRWVFDSDDSGNEAYAGQGAHSLTIGDVDADGKDEIIFGAATIDDDGTGLYSTGLGHGDALHMSDLLPNRDGMEIYMVHEEQGAYGVNGMEMHDAKTGEIVWGIDGHGWGKFDEGKGTWNGDIGRGMSADIDPDHVGSESWSGIGVGSTTDDGTVRVTGGLRAADGTLISEKVPTSTNFGIFWDADLSRELLDNVGIDKWDPATGTNSRIYNGTNAASNNGTKATPNLTADLFGDWREEVIWRNGVTNDELIIATTTDVTDHRLYTLMHNPQYRVAVAWQNVAYNQPPHTDYFLGNGMTTPDQPDIYMVGTNPNLVSNTPDPVEDAPEEEEVSGVLIEGIEYNEDDEKIGFCAVDGNIEANNAGFEGLNFLNTDNELGKGAYFAISHTAGADLTFNFRSAASSDRPGNLFINDELVTTVNFTSSGSWTDWVEHTVTVTGIEAQHLSISLIATTGSGLPNIDHAHIDGEGVKTKGCAALGGQVTPDIVGHQVVFNTEMSGAVGDIAYTWDFGDNTDTSTEASPTHLYESVGEYTVSLIAIDASEQMFTLETIINTTADDVALVRQVTKVATYLDVDYKVLVFGGDGVYSYAWDLGDGTTSTEQNIMHSYAETGRYDISLTVTDGAGEKLDYESKVFVSEYVEATTVSESGSFGSTLLLMSALLFIRNRKLLLVKK